MTDTRGKKPRTAKARKAADGTDPLLVSVSLGATIPVGDGGGGGGFQYLRPQVEIRNIRLDQPIEAQVKVAIDAAKVAWVAIDDEMEIQITEMVSGAAGQPNIRDTLAGIQTWIDGVAKKSFTNLGREVKRQKDLIVQLEGRKGADGAKL